jgi:hypothetical protein
MKMVLRVTTLGLAAACALVFLVSAVGMAAQSREPWGDSPRALYAMVADIGLGLGALCLAVTVAQLRRAAWWRQFVTRWRRLIYLAAAVAVAVPLAMSSSNSLEASSIGEGGPSLLIVIMGGAGLGVGLAALMTRRIGLGLFAALALGGILIAVAFATAR